MSNGRAVMFYNNKGGVNKTSLVEYLVRYYGYYGAEFDSNGVLAERCNSDGKKLVEYIDVDRDFILPDDKKFAFDMGGYKDHRLASLFNQANLLVVPYSVADADVDVTMTMIADLFNMHEQKEIDLTSTPILFVPTMFNAKTKGRVVKANETMEQIFNMMPDALQVDFFPLPYSNAMILSRDKNCSIWELYNNPKKHGLVTGRYYKEDAERYDDFVKKIEEYM